MSSLAVLALHYPNTSWLEFSGAQKTIGSKKKGFS
jgi:hypothetical protein